MRQQRAHVNELDVVYILFFRVAPRQLAPVRYRSVNVDTRLQVVLQQCVMWLRASTEVIYEQNKFT